MFLELKKSMITMIQQIEGLNRELETIEKPKGNSGVEERKNEILNFPEELNTIFKSAE